MTARALVLALALLAPVAGCDQAVRDAVQQGRAPGLEWPMRQATGIGKPVVVLGGLLAIAVFGGAAGVPMVRACLAALVPVNLSVEGLKWGVGRIRPDGDDHRRNSSFPSSHAANAAALAWLLARRWPRGSIGFFLLAALVAFSRVYLDRHYLSDIVAGMTLGIGLAWWVGRLRPSLDPRGLRGVPNPQASS